MIKAVVRNGMIVPCDPLPDDWQEGTEVEVDIEIRRLSAENDIQGTDAWMDNVESVASQGDPADDLRLEAAIQAIRQREKELARKRLVGLDG